MAASRARDWSSLGRAVDGQLSSSVHPSTQLVVARISISLLRRGSPCRLPPVHNVSLHHSSKISLGFPSLAAAYVHHATNLRPAPPSHLSSHPSLTPMLRWRHFRRYHYTLADVRLFRTIACSWSAYRGEPRPSLDRDAVHSAGERHRRQVCAATAVAVAASSVRCDLSGRST